jgi:hypothetical protein
MIFERSRSRVSFRWTRTEESSVLSLRLACRFICHFDRPTHLTEHPQCHRGREKAERTGGSLTPPNERKTMEFFFRR